MTTSSTNPGFPENIDHTFVEGSGPMPAADNTPPPSSPPANPYQRQPTDESLPSGDEPEALASGTIVGILGSGGMARIYKIWNEKLEMFRAVKMLLPGQRPELRDRFETEAKITAKLDHPNIVDIITVGDHNGLPFIEMEFVDGCSLDELIARHGRLPEPVCTAVGIFIARALHYAHNLEYLLYGKTYTGMIHRDLKPANIMITADGAVKLMDFGIARPQETSLHTVEGNVVGTLQYLSPEQMDGIEIDCRSDLYSFGAILYEMVTGSRTFPQATITNLMRQKALNQYRSFKDQGFHVNPALVKITERCLQSERTKRFGNAQELLAELESTHARLTDAGPEETMRSFCRNPSEYSSGRAGSARKLPVWLWPTAAAACTATGAILWFVLSPSDNTEKMHKPDAQPSHVAVAPTAPPPQETSPAPQTPPPPVTQPSRPVAQPSPSQPPKQAAVPPTPRPTPQPRRSAPAAQPVSPADQLRKKYGETDFAAVARSALSKGEHIDALKALDLAATEGGNSAELTVLRAEALYGSGRPAEVEQIARSSGITDAWLDFLCGRIAHRNGEVDRALQLFQSALTKPSVIRSRAIVRNESLYQTAAILDAQYRDAPSSTTRIQAITAWNNLKRCYMNTPEHPRFKEANERLASIR